MISNQYDFPTQETCRYEYNNTISLCMESKGYDFDYNGFHTWYYQDGHTEKQKCSSDFPINDECWSKSPINSF